MVPEEEEVVDQGFTYLKEDQQQEVTAPPVQEEVRLNPAWNDLLEVIPEGVRGNVTPHLQKWDENYQQGLQKVHSQYEPYKPFMDQGVNPEDLNNALLIQQAMEADPQEFVQKVMEFYKIQLGEQGQQPNSQDESDEDPVFDVTQHPEFQRLNRGFELLAQQTIAQNTAAEEAAVEAQIDNELNEAKQKYGEFDEGYVFQYCHANDCNIETGVQAYLKFAENLVANYKPPGANAPIMMGGGGGLPSQQTPVKNLTGQQRRALMVQMLTNAENAT